VRDEPLTDDQLHMSLEGETLPEEDEFLAPASGVAHDAEDDGDQYDADATIPTPNEALYRENALIAAARSGDQRAFTALVDTHYTQVYGLACRTVRDPDEAAEIAQDVFLAAWRNLGSFRGEARFGTWLYRITYRRCLQSIEAQQNRLAALRQFAALHLERLANEWSEMQASVAEQEWSMAIREQINALPVKYQMVLFLRHFQDLTYEEIAQQLTIPISTVKTHLFRARAMLRDRLQGVELPDVGSALRDRLPQLELPDVGNALRDHLPQIELPDVGSALRERWDSFTGAAGELLRGHLQPPLIDTGN
jgi:RNA polymerase sigma-70 factor, ECF subfamily